MPPGEHDPALIASFDLPGSECPWVDVWDEGDHLSFVLHVRGGSVCFGARDLDELEHNAREVLEAHRELFAEIAGAARESR